VVTAVQREFTLPDVGEGLTEAEIVTWRVQPGDTVTVNQVLCEIETAKAAVELPCPWAGTVGELLAEPGRTIEVGTPIIRIETGGEAPAPAAGDDEEVPNLVGYGPRQASATRRPRRSAVSRPPGDRPAPADRSDNGHARPATVPLAKPPVRKLAKDLGVDLRSISGSGEGGVITRADVERAAGAAAPSAPAPAAGGVRREPIRGVRKATAAAVTGSAFTAPHVTEFLAVDVTATMELRDRLRATREYAEVKLTPLAFVAKAVCLAAKRTPEVNASWDEPAGEIVYYDRVQLGIAAATPRGLVVPKIRDADTLSLRELAGAIPSWTRS